jgi:hypothetical protein
MGFLNSEANDKKTKGKNANGYNGLTNQNQKKESTVRYVSRLSRLVIQDSEVKKSLNKAQKLPDSINESSRATIRLKGKET